MLLTLGAAALLAGCAEAGTSAAWHDGAQVPGDSHPDGQSPPDGPSQASPDGPRASASPTVPPANTPVAGACPAVPGIVQRPGGPQFYLPCRGTEIALTIDDGPDPTYTPQILSLLARYQVRATFCVIGKRAATHPDLVKRVLDGGHHVANHTYTHPLQLVRLTPVQIHTELAKASDAIAGAGGTRPALFRSPGGAWSAQVLSQCQALGLRPLDWSVDPRDWSRPGVQHIVSTILTRTRPGAIILEHDGGGARDQTVAALNIALPRLLHAGYTFGQP